MTKKLDSKLELDVRRRFAAQEEPLPDTSDELGEPSYCPHETWQQALDRYREMILLIREQLSDLFDEYFYLVFGAAHFVRFEDPATEAELSELEQLAGFRLPKELAALYRSRGALVVNKSLWSADFRLLSASKMLEGLKSPEEHWNHWTSVGLIEVMGSYTNPEEFRTVFSPEQYTFLNTQYRCIGYQTINESDGYYFFVDSAGRYGSVTYNHDWYHFNGEAWWSEFGSLLESSPANLTFDQLISLAVNRSIFAVKRFVVEIFED